jgi:hypothetical protein
MQEAIEAAVMNKAKDPAEFISNWMMKPDSKPKENIETKEEVRTVTDKKEEKDKAVAEILMRAWA